MKVVLLDILNQLYVNHFVMYYNVKNVSTLCTLLCDKVIIIQTTHQIMYHGR